MIIKNYTVGRKGLDNDYSIDLDRVTSSDGDALHRLNSAGISGLDFTGDFTVECWVKPDVSPYPNGPFITGMIGMTAPGTYFFFDIRNVANTPPQDTRLYLHAGDSTVRSGWYVSIEPPGVDWRHVAATFDVSEPTLRTVP